MRKETTREQYSQLKPGDRFYYLDLDGVDRSGVLMILTDRVSPTGHRIAVDPETGYTNEAIPSAPIRRDQSDERDK